MSDTELSKLRTALATFLSKSQAPEAATAAEAAGVNASDVPAAATGRAAGSPPLKTPDKSATAKKGKAGAEPALPALSTPEGQLIELGKWNSMLDTSSGFAAQDAECADWFASLLHEHHL